MGQRHALAAQACINAGAAMSSGAPDILLVEDSRTTAELFVLALRANKSRASIQIARDADDALRRLLGDDADPEGASRPLPRLVLLDLHLPRLDGLEVLERLRADARTRHLPVLIYSASDLDSDRSEALRRGASGYVYKPVGFQDACAAIADLERDWLERAWPNGQEGAGAEHAS
jgi:two-component system response regulator